MDGSASWSLRWWVIDESDRPIPQFCPANIYVKKLRLGVDMLLFFRLGKYNADEDVGLALADAGDDGPSDEEVEQDESGSDAWEGVSAEASSEGEVHG